MTFVVPLQAKVLQHSNEAVKYLKSVKLRYGTVSFFNLCIFMPILVLFQEISIKHISFSRKAGIPVDFHLVTLEIPAVKKCIKRSSHLRILYREVNNGLIFTEYPSTSAHLATHCAA